jgi:hypothetical protein
MTFFEKREMWAWFCKQFVAGSAPFVAQLLGCYEFRCECIETVGVPEMEAPEDQLLLTA